MKSSDTNCLTKFAEEILALTAAKLGHVSDTTNDASDSYSPLAVVMVALRHWCHRHDIDWYTLACKAEDFLGESSAPPTLADLRCPKCGHDETFVIDVCDRVFMCISGEIGGTKSWGRHSRCECPSCTHTAPVARFLRGSS